MLALHDSSRTCDSRCGHLLGGRFLGEGVARLEKMAAFALFAFSDYVAVDECVNTEYVEVSFILGKIVFINMNKGVLNHHGIHIDRSDCVTTSPEFECFCINVPGRN